MRDAAYFGPEAEFFVFNDVRYGQGMNYAFHEIDSKEGIWNSGKKEEPNTGPQAAPEGGLLPGAPVDSLQDLRTEMVLTLESLGVKVEAHHHEVATAGQGEIDMRFTTLTRMADNLMLYKYVVKNVARKHGMTATFMPKPLFEDNASGMHVHQSLWKGDSNLFYGEAHYAGLSELGRFYIGGLLKHAWALCGLVRAHHQLLPPAGAGLRSAHQPRLLAAQPLGLLPHPHVFAEPARKARGVPYARPLLQRLPCVRGHADGGARRHREPHRPRRAHRQEPIRPVAGGGQGRALDAGLAGPSARGDRARPRVPAAWATYSPRT